ncbi:MAG: hypothetical protein RLY71_2666 [Pseudomonadota bacterium]|jgi:hypothetical protein
MSDATSFAKLVPGFEFLQGLVKNAGSSMPNMGQWIAPTIDPVELDRRIQELKTVQFWLEQNARMMSATIQALEVQRMTLATLQGMNVSVGNLQDALKIHVPSASPSEPAKASTARSTKPEPEAAPADVAEGAPGVVDPMQWWNSLTQQFTELATTAMNAAGEAAQNAAATAASAAQTAAEAATTATANAQAAAAAAASDLVKPVRRAASKAKPAEAPTPEPAAKTPRSRRTAT